MNTLTPAIDSRQITLWDDLRLLFKAHARITWTDDDALCDLYIKSAISRIEQWCEAPIVPKAYDWVSGCPPVDGKVPLPVMLPENIEEAFAFGACARVGWVDTPTTWPYLLEVGFATGADMPDGLQLAIFSLALGLYELRSNPEMQGIYAADVMNGNLTRYWTPRC